MIRHHQFEKVEMVSIVAHEDSEAELDRMTGCAEGILQKLKLPYRVMALSAGDIGFSAHRTYDLEVWAPGVGKWLEVSSCSTFTDYQARRANLRFRPGPGEKPEHVHTLNGSALALPRVLAALLETYQEEDGSVTVPEQIRPYVGFERIGPPAD